MISEFEFSDWEIFIILKYVKEHMWRVAVLVSQVIINCKLNNEGKPHEILKK